ncbi:hypothetical protein LTR91_009914 [Friedmanniomyces endolithicus]|uniref:HORMA domain-containing protein n=2 Tax=Dothideomycetidae TaxID=451867 RepID=A0AAN6QU11_9PEZI|nr:hypothetical protein LTR94_008086 [Friedmanniomyces endolithicus]KAK5148180.1 hypothetical protein LTR32_000492 [Rachicladosporium monterosium]KAK0776588.1 hypothetical protein LTR75_016217 [Friedmanniomyces endolithicus]KAK0778827.1 hypothetical protein LTR38_014681 [Friedmanniomyces endolithicus]KAK0804894.1 hypothetical protein LTR59_004232 [Friedmanniomyces endolithicus]
MAMMPMQRTRNAATVTKIDQRQSLEIIQTMLHGSLSALSYCRAFFAKKVFDSQVYKVANQITPYEQYAIGKLASYRGIASELATTMQVLRRGRSKRADAFLDWLEKGAFPALRAGHLRALQVYVHADPLDRSKVIEMYTFTIKYKDADSRLVPSGVEFDASGVPLVSVEATNLAFQTLLLQLYDLCDRLPVLPQERFISMELFYVPGFEEQHRAVDFVPGFGATLSLPEAEGWEKLSENLPELSGLFHGSSLKVTSLVPERDRNKPAPLQHALPAECRYILVIPKLDLISYSNATPPAHQSSQESPTAASGTVAIVTPSTIAEEAHTEFTAAGIAQSSQQNATFGMAQAESDHSIVSAPDTYDSVNTQSATTLAMTTAVRDMMQPEPITQGDTQTHTLIHLQPPTLSMSPGTPDRTTASPRESPTLAACSPVKPALSPMKAQKLNKDRSRLQQQALALVKQAGSKSRRGHAVWCQCGHQNEEGDMVQCGYCRMWQHLPCYGYMTNGDPRLPDDHACYQCMLGGEEKLTLHKLQDLAMKRRAMHSVLQRGLRTQTEFAHDLELEPAVAERLYGYLKSSEYVAPASGSHQAGYKASGKVLFVPTFTGDKHELMLRSLFEPLLHISHHVIHHFIVGRAQLNLSQYRLPTEPAMRLTSLSQRLLASQSNDMPPPATPASQLRLRNAITPASGLDLRAATPSRMASRTYGLRSMTRKRSLDDARQEGSPAKRTAPPPSTASGHVKSMQSRFAIDANGLSSSPARSAWGQ